MRNTPLKRPKITLCKYLKNSIHIKAKITRHLRKITFEIIQNVSNVISGVCGKIFRNVRKRVTEDANIIVYALPI